ncbi:AAA family ATPase [Micropruina sp.]|uniref:AAA family ATPase n=1 Tax=Micropruina sp. TaxID=2737536 RepID=UPI0039E2DD9A
MKIIKLEAENIKRLKAVAIEPDGTLQIVTGRNAQGKSSVLDAIWLALGGGQASKDTPRPIRDGEDEARVTLDLGNLTVTRTWDAEKGKTTLVVRAPDGSRYQQPQTLLDQLVGKLSFDPLAFTRLTAREQRQALLDLLGLDFTAADRERARLYDERLETGRRAHAYGDLPKLPKGAPMVEVPAADLLGRINEAAKLQQDIDDTRAAIARDVREVEEIDRRIARLQQDRDATQARIADRTDQLGVLPLPADIDQLRAQVADLEASNAEARANRQVAEKREAQKALQEQYTALTHRIDGIDDSKRRALAAAQMPVDGLGFDDQGVTFNGVPFGQASSAEQIRVSLAMAMALNPSLRVIRILDGSLLDADSMQAIAGMAADHDYQVWVERVSDDAESAVVIEDGQVAR